MKKYITEDHTRSVVRSIIWRIIGILFLALVTYIVTQSWVVTTLVTVIHHSVSVLGYYLHERFWLQIDKHWKVKYRSLFRVIVYEIVYGVLILGTVTWLLTGEVKQATLITCLYIGNKLWIYVVYDKIWNQIDWRKKIVTEAV